MKKKTRANCECWRRKWCTCKKMLESRGIFSLAWILKALESPPYLREVSIGAERRSENERGDESERVSLKLINSKLPWLCPFESFLPILPSTQFYLLPNLSWRLKLKFLVEMNLSIGPSRSCGFSFIFFLFFLFSFLFTYFKC